MIMMNIVYASISYPAGALSDRINRNTTLLSGIGMLVIADLILAFSTALPSVLVGFRRRALTTADPPERLTLCWGVRAARTETIPVEPVWAIPAKE